MRSLMVTILIVILGIPNAWAATYFIDFASGNDTNTGITQAFPWKRAPGMNGFAGAYQHQAGDRFIFKGGVTWPSTAFPFNIANSGISGNPDYYGVDKNWYAGSHWARPLFDLNFILLVSGTAGVPVLIEGKSFVTIDNLEIAHMAIPASGSYGAGSIAAGFARVSNNITIQNCYIHDWRPLSTTLDSDNGGIFFSGGTGNIVDANTIGPGQAPDGTYHAASGCCIRNGSRISNNYLTNCSDMYAGVADQIYGNTFADSKNSFQQDPVFHPNAIWHNNTSGQATHIYNNIFYGFDTQYQLMLLHPGWGGATNSTYYVYNNIYWGVNHINIDEAGIVTENSNTSAHVFNNTCSNGDGVCLYIVNRNQTYHLTLVEAQNNHWITDSWVKNGFCYNGTGGSGTAATVINANNITQPTAAAVQQGYTLDNLFTPTAATNITVNAGTNLTSLGFSSLDTDKQGVMRQPVDAWDIGAYEYVPLYYVRADAPAGGDGSDWAHAWQQLPAVLKRGAVYYMADGAYNGHTFNDPVAGEQKIIIKKATLTDHGTDNGWLAYYGDGAAFFPDLVFGTSYYVLDGQTGGGPGHWNSGFGFEVTSTPPPDCRDHGAFIYFNAGASFVSIERTRIHASNNNYPRPGVKGVFGNDHLTFAYNSIDTLFMPAFHMGSWTHTLIENNYIADVRSTGTVDPRGYCDNMHAEGISSIGTNTDMIIRYNIWDKITGTAVLAGVNDGASVDWKVYGNIFSRSTTTLYYYYESGGHQTMTGLLFANNIIVNMLPSSVGSLAIQMGSNNSVYNNIWYNNPGNTFYLSWNGVTHDNNAFIGNYRPDCAPACDINVQGISGETGGLTGKESPFINATDDPLAGDYRLSKGSILIDHGKTLDTDGFLNKDMLGNSRGMDGAWDIGVYEYVPLGLGDVSGDGRVTMYDAALVLKYTVGGTLTTAQQAQADINGDSAIDAADAMAIARKSLGLN